MSSGTSIEKAQEARSFKHFSIHNAVEAEKACDELACRAYEDIFTFRRWKAQGYVVRKGEKGTRITTWIPEVRKDDNGEEKVVGKRPKVVVVFCRHQVERLP